MPTYTLVCPFLEEDPLFAFGVEFGLLWARMSDPANDLIEDYVSRWLQDQVTLAAGRSGWRVAEMTPAEGSCGRDWFWVRMERV